MSVSKIFVLTFLSLSAIAVNSAEVDQFTRRDEILKDSSELLNQKANQAILSAIKIANQKNSGCNEELLYKELQEYFSNHYKGKLVKEIIESNEFDKRMIPVKESVYQDWRAWDGLGMGLKLFAKSGLTMSGILKIGDQQVGTDKFEHMFGQGFNYFKKNYLEGKGEVKAVQGGTSGEKFILGGNKLANGVFSYGDLSANFNGMRMWNHMLQKRNDVLGNEFNIGPYVACENNQWAQVKDIDFKNYIDDSFDESINCANFPSERTVNKFKNRLNMMGMSCPMNQSKLDDMVVKYKQMSKWIINTKGNKKVKYFGDFTN